MPIGGENVSEGESNSEGIWNVMVNALRTKWCDPVVSQCTWIESEETGGASKELPGESRILLEVTDEDVIQSLRHVDAIENVWI